MTTNQAIYRALLGHSCVGKVGGGSYTIISLLMKANGCSGRGARSAATGRRSGSHCPGHDEMLFVTAVSG